MHHAVARCLRSLLLVTTWLLVGPPPGALGQGDPRGDTVVLRPVVVTATRVAAPADAVASAVTVITGAELRARGVRTVGEALRDVPGASVVETGSYGGQSALFLRGGESDYVKVLLDGAPLNQPGGAIDYADLTTDNIDRIEIVRGPASVLYGSDAVTGVIQIFTRVGAGAPRLGVETRAGTYGASDVAADVTGGSARLAYSARVTRFASRGLYLYNNDYRNVVGSGRVRLTPDARTEVGLAYRYGDDVYHYPTDGTGQPVDSNQFTSERGPTASLDLTRRLGRALEVRLLGTWQETRIAFSDEPDSPADDGSFTSHDLVRRSSAGLAMHWRPRPGMVFTGGAELEDQRQRGRSEFAASYGTFPDSMDVGRWNGGYYGQALLGTSGPLAVTLGARLDRNSQFDSHATGRAGVSYRLGRTRVRAAAGTGFKEPTFFENFAQGFVHGNPDLKPERSTSWEVGMEHTADGGRVTVALTYFDQRFRDLIEYTGTPVPPDTLNYYNVAGAQANGVEGSITAALGRGVVASLIYSYLHTRGEGGPGGLFAAGRRLLRRPTHSLTHELSIPLAARGHAALTVHVVGDREDVNDVTLRPYAHLNLAADYDVVRRGPNRSALAVTARVENLTNDDAREVAGFLPRRRTVTVGARLGLGG